jgi:hypothetical protein
VVVCVILQAIDGMRWHIVRTAGGRELCAVPAARLALTDDVAGGQSSLHGAACSCVGLAARGNTRVLVISPEDDGGEDREHCMHATEATSRFGVHVSC